MSWVLRHRLRHYLENTMWVGPCMGILVGIIGARISLRIDAAYGLKLPLHADAVRTVLITLASGLFSFVVFLASAMLIALQLASAQMTPRVIALVFRDISIKIAMTLFVTTCTLTVSVVLRSGDDVPFLTTYLATYGCVVSLIVFLFVVDHFGTMLRPTKAVQTVAARGQRVIEWVYPRTYNEARHGDAAAEAAAAVTPRAADVEGGVTSMVPSRRDGVVIACDIEGIVRLAQHANCALEMVPQVGDFIARGSPLFNIFGDSSRLKVNALCQLVAIGTERSLEQDPAFAFRILVDIASKALSPAINDPTTAVLAIDQIHHLLRRVGNRELDDERVRDRTGRLRLIYRTPGWADFVHLAVTEVRQYGCQSIQVNRRLRAMLESLIQILPPARAQALHRELDLLNRIAARSFPEREDQMMATISDSQGVGGSPCEGAVNGKNGNGNRPAAPTAPAAGVS
jgi:uncharacterized membrane protein